MLCSTAMGKRGERSNSGTLHRVFLKRSKQILKKNLQRKYFLTVGFLTVGCWPRRCQVTCAMGSGRLVAKGRLVTKAVWLRSHLLAGRLDTETI